MSSEGGILGKLRSRKGAAQGEKGVEREQEEDDSLTLLAKKVTALDQQVRTVIQQQQDFLKDYGGTKESILQFIKEGRARQQAMEESIASLRKKFETEQPMVEVSDTGAVTGEVPPGARSNSPQRTAPSRGVAPNTTLSVLMKIADELTDAAHTIKDSSASVDRSMKELVAQNVVTTQNLSEINAALHSVQKNMGIEPPQATPVSSEVKGDGDALGLPNQIVNEIKAAVNDADREAQLARDRLVKQRLAERFAPTPKQQEAKTA